MNPNNDTSGANTVLIVILLLIVVGGAVWYFTKYRNPDAENQDDSLDINVSLGGEGNTASPQ